MYPSQSLSFKNLFNGLFKRAVKNFTTTPVRSAAITVPSLVPTIVNSKNRSDKTTAKTTQLISNPILTFPKSLCIVSETAFTKASPEFIITLAITEREIPNPSTIVPVNIINNRCQYTEISKKETSHIPKSVKTPNKNDNGICSN